MKDEDKKAKEDKRKETERELDEALEEFFPASDPLPMSGTSAGAPEDRESDEPVKKGGKG